MDEQKKKQKISIELKVTDRCNQECFHCMNRNGFVQGVDVNGKLFGRRLREWTAEAGLSPFFISEVRMTGGEPLLVPETVLGIARACRRAGIKSGINTNGTLLERSILRSLKKSGLRVIKVSFDTVEEALYAKMRRPLASSSCLGKSVDGIRASVETGFDVVLRFTLSRLNRGQLLPCYAAACEMGVSLFQVKPVIHSGRARDAESPMSAEEVNREVEELYAGFPSRSIPVEILCWPPGKGNDFRYKICGNFQKIYVDTDLKVTICNYIEDSPPFADLASQPLAEVLRRRLPEIWTSADGCRLIAGCPNVIYFQEKN